MALVPRWGPPTTSLEGSEPVCPLLALTCALAAHLETRSPSLSKPHLPVQPEAARARPRRASSWARPRGRELGRRRSEGAVQLCCSASSSLTTESPPSCHAFPSFGPFPFLRQRPSGSRKGQLRKLKIWALPPQPVSDHGPAATGRGCHPWQRLSHRPLPQPCQHTLVINCHLRFPSSPGQPLPRGNCTPCRFEESAILCAGSGCGWGTEGKEEMGNEEVERTRVREGVDRKIY